MSVYPAYEPKHYGRRQDFINTVRATGSPAAVSALESLDASLWLLAGERVSQSLFLLDHTIEVAFKGFLGESKSSRFNKIFERVHERIGFESIARSDIDMLRRMRNSIVHAGAQPEEEFAYLGCNLNTALPALEEFYRKAYGLNLRDMLFHPLARESSTVRRYIGVAKEDTTLPRTGILVTFRWQYFRDAIVGSGNLLYDPDGWLRDIDEWRYELNGVARTRAEQRGWDIIGEGADTQCIICGESPCIVAISEPDECEGEEVFYAEALHCPSCGLYIDRSHGTLAKLDYGPITRERIGPDAWENEIPR